MLVWRRMVAVAQSAERQVVALEVAGSSPVGHPHQNNKALEPETIRPQGFWLIEGVLRVNSHELHRYGGLAHMVETSIHMCETSFSGFRAGDS
jgi:hypothetical protein